MSQKALLLLLRLSSANLRRKLCSAVQAAQLAAPCGPELEAVTHDAVYGEPALQVTQPLGYMVCTGPLHHA